MAIDVFQSQKMEILLSALIQELTQTAHSPAQVLQPKWVIVPNHGIEQWLKQSIATQLGISANLKFSALRTTQWQLYQQVLGAEVVAKVPQLLNMKWRIFLFLSGFLSQPLATGHALFALFERIHQHSKLIQDPAARQSKQQSLLYWIADHCSRLFSNYIIYRGECVAACPQDCQCPQNWLSQWRRGQALALKRQLRLPEKALLEAQPQLRDFALQQAEQLETWQRYIWQHTFAEDHAAIQALAQQFWLRLEAEATARQALPQQLYVFTVLALPPAQLLFLRRLAQYVTVKIYHYSPSQEYWADSVDPKWRAKYALQHPAAAVYYESRHPLLTRLGKQARDHSALLSQLAGGEEGLWQDHFVAPATPHLLAQLQSDILELIEPQPGQYRLSPQDQSLQIHICHSSYRQLEVLKTQLLHWLSVPSDPPRQPDDILILVPNLSELEAQIRTVFASHDALKQAQLPIKIAGVAPLEAIQLWQALSLRISLLQQRLSIEQFIDWLSLPPIQTLYQLNFEQLERITELLQQAGFKRGFDALHLQHSLSPDDQDYRFSLRYALNRLALSVAMPEHALYAEVLGMPMVQASDFELIACLIRIYNDLQQRRDWLQSKPVAEQASLAHSLERLTQEVQDFAQVAGISQVELALSQLKRIIHVMDTQQLALPLQYLLDEIANSIAHQLGQTEPTGQISFAQMGQLRPLPYRLMVCLNLDAGSFPHRDQQIPFDLMDLLRAELGDRSRLEDDQGAFLDALLQARDSFWLFYNGFDVADQQPRDPSSVLQELVAHLALIVQKDPEQPATRHLHGIEVPSQLQRLYQVHPLQPFDPQGFVLEPWQAPRFEDQWYQVAQHLRQAGEAWHWLDQSYPLLLESDLLLDSSQWIKDLAHPARHFLRNVGVRTLAASQQLQNYEALQLDGLQRYAVRDYLQQQSIQPSSRQRTAPPDMALLQDQLPIGKMQQASWLLAQQELEQVGQRVYAFAPALTTLSKQHWRMDPQTQFVLTRPSDAESQIWVSLSASSCRDARALGIWLEYLLWQAWHPTQHAGLERIALFSNLTLRITGVDQSQARQLLQRWLALWRQAQHQPVVLPPAIFADLGHGKTRPVWEIDDQGQCYCSNLSQLRQRWLGNSYYPNKSTFNARNDQGCMRSPEWSLLLAEDQAETLFNQHVERYAAAVYAPMSQYIEVLT
jgi:exodeoxyribonuclease V gamma subunit